MSKGNSKSNNKSNGKSNGNGNGNSNGFLISENQNPEISAASTASLSRTFYVSLDNADKVIEGAPLFPRSLRKDSLLPVKRFLLSRGDEREFF